MRIIDCLQRSEEWDRWRARPTASEFGSFITPTRGDYSAQATAYAAKVVAKRLGVYVEPPPSFWMQWGIDHEQQAKTAYTAETGNPVTDVGFIIDDEDMIGGSPDGLIGDEGVLEVKCPSPEKLILWHAGGVLPAEHKVQCQSLLFIAEKDWLDFWAWHPYVKPFLVHVKPDLGFHERIATCVEKLLADIKEIEEKLQWNP